MRYYLRKLILLIVLTNLCGRLLVAQNSVKGFTEKEFKELIKKVFINVVSGQNKNTIGTFGGLDIKDATATLNATKVVKNNNVFSVNLTAGVSDGISSIFSNSKLNSNVSGTLKYSTMIDKGSAVYFYNDALGKKIMTGSSINWFNFSYQFNSQLFRLFDPVASFSDQVKKKNYVSHKFGIEFNHLKFIKDDPSNTFFSFGAFFSLNNNLNDLNKVELTDVTNYTATTGQRTSTKKYNVYTGNYESNLLGGSITADYYRFMFDNGHAALHFFPAVAFQEEEKTKYSVGVGLLVSFKNAKDNAVVNTELYANFTDLTNATDSKNKLLERNDIGLRFAFPINFNN